MVARNINAEEYTLQWDPADQRLRERRQAQSCRVRGLSYCNADNAVRQVTLFGTSTGAPPITNCDEFPFAGSMEGGSAFLGLQSATNLLGVTRTCVAAYQNDMQGQCNSE